jgi:hypothetical protein
MLHRKRVIPKSFSGGRGPTDPGAATGAVRRIDPVRIRLFLLVCQGAPAAPGTIQGIR